MSVCDPVVRLVVLFVLAAGTAARAQDLVTPVRVGRADAPLTLNVWAQQDYSHLAARPAIADAFTVVFDDWARAHPGVQLRVSVMPGLELHKAKLQLAAAAGPPARRRVDRQLLAAAAEERRAAAGRLLARRGPPRLPPVHDPDAVGSRGPRLRHVARDRLPRALLPQGSRPDAAATWDELLDTASRVAREQRVAGYLYNAGPLGGDGLRSPRHVLGAGRRARRPRRAADFRRRTASPRDAAPARLPARHDAARRVAALGARQQRLPAADGRRHCRRRRDVSRRQLAAEGSAGGPGPRRVREVGHRADSAGRRRHAIDRHRRLGLGRLRARPGAAARRD